MIESCNDILLSINFNIAKIVKHFLNKWKWILVFNSNSIETFIIYIISQSIF